MERRKLGRNGPDVPAVGLGCMGMSISYGEPNDEESIATMHRALDLGVNLLVTSDAYGAGVNETLVARAIKGQRNRFLVATKFGNLSLAGRGARRRCSGAVRRTPGLGASGVRREPEAPRRGHDRHLRAAPRRPDRADRRHGRRDVAAGRAGKGALPRLVGSGRADDSPRAQGASHHRARNGVFAVEPRRRARRSADVPRARHRVHGLRAARARIPYGDHQDARCAAAEGPAARASALRSVEHRTQPRSAEAARGHRGRRTRRRRRRWRSRGFSREAKTSCRSLARSGASIWRRTARRWISSSRRKSSARSTTRSRPSSLPVRAIRRSSYKGSGFSIVSDWRAATLCQAAGLLEQRDPPRSAIRSG